MRERNRRYRENNPGEYSKYSKQWYKDNPDWYRQYAKNKRRTDLKYNLNYKMGKNIGKALKGNKAGRSWEFLTGYTLAELIERLNETMPVGYAWKDYLNGDLHIDHIIPISAFNFNCPEHIDFKRCWALENLRLLPAKENMIKHNKLDRPFQPALRI